MEYHEYIELINLFREIIKYGTNRSNKVRNISNRSLEILSDLHFYERLPSKNEISEIDDMFLDIIENTNPGCNRKLYKLIYKLHKEMRIADDDEKNIIHDNLVKIKDEFNLVCFNNKILLYEIIYEKLKGDCENQRDMWFTTIYGSDWDDGESENDKYKEAYDPYNINRYYFNELLKLDYCGTTPKLSQNLCKKCKDNFCKVKYFFDNDKLDILARNWDTNYPKNEVEMDTIKRPQTKKVFIEKNPDLAYLVNISEERITNDIIFTFDVYFDGDLNNYLNEINTKEILNIGWHFNGDLIPLLKCTNLKGLILGHWYNGDLNVLKNHPSLQFIKVQRSYYRRLCPEIYNITFV